MAKDYFQDIVPPGDGGRPKTRAPQASEAGAPETPPPDRSIRNINIAPRARSPLSDARGTPPPRDAGSDIKKRGGRRWLWALAILSVLVLGLLALLFVFRKTTVNVTPQSQPVVFDRSAEFTAYPASSAPSGTLSYTVQSNDFEDSEVVPSNGTRHAETKAHGSITVVNDYSSAPVKLVKNTRFASPGGYIFRVPADVLVPAKSAAPGKVSVTVIADQAGAAYDLGPTARFTVPGLRSNPAMYAGVYAYSTASTTGGFSGDEPAVAQADLDAAIAGVRARLQDKAAAFESAQKSDTATPLGERVTFADMPNTPEAGNTVRIHETAHVDVALAPSDTFAGTVAQTVAANAQNGSVMLVPGRDFAVNAKNNASVWGSDPIPFTLSGQGLIVWRVDTQALARALAGRSAASFQTIVSNFPGVQSARARIEPFWDSTFPSAPADIHITIEAPKTTP